jgi:hypothetical protein
MRTFSFFPLTKRFNRFQEILFVTLLTNPLVGQGSMFRVEYWRIIAMVAGFDTGKPLQIGNRDQF